MIRRNRGKKLKYNNKKVIFEGIKFDSTAEMEYYKHLLTDDSVRNIELQPEYILQPSFKTNDGKTILALKYKADFMVEYYNGNCEVVDIKGQPDAQAKIKRKLFIYNYPQKNLKRLVKHAGRRVDYFENRKRIESAKKDKKDLLSKKL